MVVLASGTSPGGCGFSGPGFGRWVRLHPWASRFNLSSSRLVFCNVVAHMGDDGTLPMQDVHHVAEAAEGNPQDSAVAGPW